MTVEELLELYPFLNKELAKLLVNRGLTVEALGVSDVGGTFNPSTNILSLPENAPAGSVAHEVFHAANALAPEFFPDVNQQDLGRYSTGSKNFSSGFLPQEILGAAQLSFGGLESGEQLAHQLAGNDPGAGTTDTPREAFAPLFDPDFLDTLGGQVPFFNPRMLASNLGQGSSQADVQGLPFVGFDSETLAPTPRSSLIGSLKSKRVT